MIKKLMYMHEFFFEKKGTIVPFGLFHFYSSGILVAISYSSSKCGMTASTTSGQN